MSNRILYIINSIPFFLSHRSDLAIAAQQRGLDVHVAAPYAPEVTHLQELGMSHIDIPLGRKSINPLREMRSLLAMINVIKRTQPDIIHNLTIKPVIYGSIAARFCQKRPVIHSITGLGYVFTQGGMRATFIRRVIINAYRFALRSDRDAVIFQNRDDQKLFLENSLIKPSHAVLIRGSGVCLDRFVSEDEPNGDPKIVFIGRMLSHKGVSEFVDAARILRKGGLKARFLLVGDVDPGNPSAIEIERLQNWSREGFVEWLGYQNDIPSILRSATLVCLPSYREGVPRVLLEAGASGRAVIASDVPGCREVVRHMENGLLVRPRDAEALARAIDMLLSNAELRKQMGRRGREIVAEEFSNKVVIEKTLQLYNDMMNGRKPRAERSLAGDLSESTL